MSGICPSCGYNLTADTVVERDGWRLDPRGGMTFEGRHLSSRVTWSQILHALAREGRVLSSEVLLARVSDSENINALASQIAQLRKALRQAGVPDPIVSHHGAGRGGYQWRGGQVVPRSRA